jgi:hypothetical protein
MVRRVINHSVLSAKNILNVFCPNVSLLKSDFDKFLNEFQFCDNNVIKINFKIKGKAKKERSFVKDASTGYFKSIKEEGAPLNEYTKEHEFTTCLMELPTLGNDIYDKALLTYLTNNFENNASSFSNPSLAGNMHVLIVSYDGHDYYHQIDHQLLKLIYSAKTLVSKRSVRKVVEHEENYTALIEDNFDSIVEKFGEERIRSWITDADKDKITKLLEKSNIRLKQRKDVGSVQEFD